MISILKIVESYKFFFYIIRIFIITSLSLKFLKLDFPDKYLYFADEFLKFHRLDFESLIVPQFKIYLLFLNNSQ